MTRRHWLNRLAALASTPLLAEANIIRGRLRANRQLETPSGLITLSGDSPTLLVLDDERLLGKDFEATGAPGKDNTFTIAPIHTKPMYVYLSDKRLGVSYWCDICYIRTYAPGNCWCCQEYTKLDPKDPNTPERRP